MNRDGNPASLVPAPTGNTRNLQHGAYSTGRALAPRAAEIADAIMEAPHVVALDRIGAEEIGAIVAQLERIDAVLEDGRVEGKRGQARALIDLRGRLSGKLERWLASYGMTPLSRATWATTLATGGWPPRSPAAAQP